MTVKTVLLFDIDGTLIDAGGAGQAAMESAIAEHFKSTKPVTGIATAGRTDRAIAVDLFRFYEVEMTDEIWPRYLESYLRLLPQSLKTKSGEILPGVVALLEKLAVREDLLIGLLTGNFAKGAQLKLSHYGLEHHFKFGGYGDHHVDRDDVAREAYRVAGTHHPSIASTQVWVIGDTPADIRCGRAIGAKVLAVATGKYSAEELQVHQPDLLLNDLSEPDVWLKMIGVTSE